MKLHFQPFIYWTFFFFCNLHPCWLLVKFTWFWATFNKIHYYSSLNDASFPFAALTRKVRMLDHSRILNDTGRQLEVCHLRWNWILYFAWQALLFFFFFVLSFFNFGFKTARSWSDFTGVIQERLFQPQQKKMFA